METFYKQKRYVVVGASSGIGRCASIKLAEKGASVILVGRDVKRLNDTVGMLKDFGGNYQIVPFDITNLDGIGEVVAHMGKNGSVDGFIYCAGTGLHTRIKSLEYEAIDRVMKVHFYGFIEMIRHLIPFRNKVTGLNIAAASSLASTVYRRYMIPLSASKAALESAIRVLSDELYSKKINISGVRLAYVDTPILDGLRQEYGSIENFVKSIHYQKVVIPPDVVADVLIELVGEKAKYFTGSLIPINGGAAF